MTAKRQILICGGGPSGLAAALLFADRGWDEVVLVERSASPTDYEKNKAFNYLISGRAQALLGRLGIADALPRYGVSAEGFPITTITPKSEVKVGRRRAVGQDRDVSYWSSRQKFQQMLGDAIEARTDGRIRLLYGHTFAGLHVAGDGAVDAVVTDASGQAHRFRPTLLLGCDGLGSKVRKALCDLGPQTAADFAMNAHPSASTGLYFKVLNLPAAIPIRGVAEPADDNSITYVFESLSRDSRNAMGLFAYPVAGRTEPRTVNIIRKPDHHIWEKDTAESVLHYLAESLPQLDVRSLVPLQEAEDFAALTPGVFPAPQYCAKVHAKLGPAGQPLHCLLIGDAAHAFPPDLGQGVNAALEDLSVLDRALDRAGDDLDAALRAYEHERLPDSAALVRLVQTVYPYQYNHAPWRLRLWTAKFVLSMLMHKALPASFDKPAVMLVQDHDVAYRDIERRIARNQQRIRRTGAVVVVISAVIVLAGFVAAAA